jgi:hypothetical protein
MLRKSQRRGAVCLLNSSSKSSAKLAFARSDSSPAGFVCGKNKVPKTQLADFVDTETPITFMEVLLYSRGYTV